MKFKILLFLSLISLLVIFWATMPSQKVKVIFCDVGQGDATLVIYKNWQMLIDSGPNNKKVLTCLERNIPFWDKRIEVFLITHGDSDHSGGVMDVFNYYKVVNFFSNGDLDKEVEQKYYSIKLNTFDIIKTNMISFEVVNSSPADAKAMAGKENSNEESIAGILNYKATPSLKTSEVQVMKIFMSGDITADVERRLVWQKVLTEKVDILKVSHHGSKEATSEELLDVLKPKMAVISVGVKNKFGHPTKEVLDRLKEKGIEVKRTDINREVHVVDVIDK